MILFLNKSIYCIINKLTAVKFTLANKFILLGLISRTNFSLFSLKKNETKDININNAVDFIFVYAVKFDRPFRFPIRRRYRSKCRVHYTQGRFSFMRNPWNFRDGGIHATAGVTSSQRRRPSLPGV